MAQIGDITKRNKTIRGYSHEVMVGFYDKDGHELLAQKEIWEVGTHEYCKQRAKQLK